MKKKLLLFIFLTNCLLTFANPELTSYRWRNDDGNQTTATWKAANNTASTVGFVDTPIRVRLQIANQFSGFSNTINVNPLQYSKNNGTWVSISNATTNDFYFINSTNIANNTGTTQQISTGSFESGIFKSDNSSSTIFFSTETETEYSIAPSASYDKTATYRFQIPGLSSYPVYPTLNSNASYCSTTKPTVSDVVYNLNQQAVPLTANGTNLLWYTAATGGTGSTTAPTPSTAAAGNTYYWVSSTNGCESARTKNLVTVNSSTPATHLNFDGIDDYVQVPAGINVANSSFTVEFMAKRSSSGSDNYVLTQGVENNSKLLHIGFRSNNDFTFAFWYDDINIPVANYVADTEWHHWACVYNVTNNTRQVYQDGVLVGSDSSLAPYTGDGILQIGAKNSSQNFFKGNLDDIRIWNVTKTAVQINGSKNCELQGTETGLVSYYKFNQGFDASNNSAITTLTATKGTNGTLTNFALTGTTSNWLAGSSIVTGSTCTALSSSSFDISNNSNVYPNPTKGSVMIQVNNLTNVTVSVCDLNGRVLLNKVLSANESTIDISNFQSGMYLFKIKSAEGEVVKKVIKH